MRRSSLLLLLLLTVLTPVFASPRGDADKLTRQAEGLGAKGKWSDALPLLDQAIQADATYAHAWAVKGLALGLLGKNEEALTCANKVIELQPNDTSGYLLKGEIYRSQHDFTNAAQAFDQACKLDPKDGQAEVAYGGILLDQAKFTDAEAHFRKATELLPGYEFAWYNRGIALLKMKDYKRALYCLDEASFLNSKDGPTALQKGIALYRLNRKQEARLSLQRAIKIDAKLGDKIPTDIRSALNLK